MTVLINSPTPSVRCNPEYYSTFIVSTLGLLALGIILGHISQSSGKLFRILNKFFFYLCLPCIAVYCPVAVKLASPHLQNYDDILYTLGNCALYWFGTMAVFGVVAYYRGDRAILLHGALAAQFIIHGNDLTFGKKLLESSCNINHPQVNTSPNQEQNIDFNFLELPDVLMPFLVFLPLTNGIVKMSKQPLSGKNFALAVISQMGKMGLSYFGLAVGLTICGTLDGIEASNSFKIKHYFQLSIDAISLCGTLMILLTGVYLYHVLMNLELGAIDTKLCICLILVTNTGFLFASCIFKHFNFNRSDIVILICRSCTPSSLYVQYYILKHTSKVSNYISSFVGTIFMGTLLMYVVILDYDVLSRNGQIKEHPTAFYNTTQRAEFLIASVVILIPALMMYTRRHQSLTRKMVLFILLPQFVSHLALMFYLAFSPDNKTAGLCISCVLMFNFLYQGILIALLRIHCFSPAVSRNWMILSPAALAVSLAIPAVLYATVCIVFPEAEYGNNVYNILDLKNDKKTYYIGSISLGAVKITFLLIYAAILIIRFFGRRTEAYADREQTSERKNSIKIIFYYQILTQFIGLSFFIRNAFIKGNDTPKLGVTLLNVIEGMQVLNMLLCDLFGLVMSFVFCVSPGNMDVEFKRFMFLPKLAQKQFQKMKPAAETVDIEDLALLDVDRCRRFQLYHKATFLTLYQTTINNDLVQFKGSQLMQFLLHTAVAESKGDAMDICNSYFRGGLFTHCPGLLQRRVVSFSAEEDAMYEFTSDDSLPNYEQYVSQSRHRIPYMVF